MFLRRDGRGGDRFLWPKAALLVLGGGLWFAGVLVGRDDLTGIALGLLCVGVLLSVLGRRAAEREEEEEDAPGG